MSAVLQDIEPTVMDLVEQHYEFPAFIKKRGYQISIINELGQLPRAGYYLDQGTGKTFCSTVAALYKLINGADVVICIMPPILITGWYRWLKQIRAKQGEQLRILPYRGSPKERQAMRLEQDFILMGMQIFKLDHERFMRALSHKKVVVLVDEATSIKNVSSQNYKKVLSFSAGQQLMALTGTPLTTPIDGYGMTKHVAPSLYRNLHQFENIHVASRDYFGKIEAWKNLPLLAENMKVNSARVLRQEAIKDLPTVLYDPLYYDLDPKHYRLYKELAEEQLLPLQNGGKIDATSVQKLFNALQQIIVNYDYFADDPACISNSIGVVEQVLDELAGQKLVIFAKYRMTNQKLVKLLEQKYGAVAVFGDVAQGQQRKNIDRFIDDPTCQVFIGQPTSAGYGVDGLQTVCSDVLFLELPDVPRDFHQAVARIWRDGLKRMCRVRIAVAEGTMQEARLRALLDKDSLIGEVQRNYQDLRDAIFGNKGSKLARSK